MPQQRAITTCAETFDPIRLPRKHLDAFPGEVSKKKIKGLKLGFFFFLFFVQECCRDGRPVYMSDVLDNSLAGTGEGAGGD